MMKHLAVILLVLSTALANETCCSGSLQTEGAYADKCHASWSFSCCTDKCYGPYKIDKNFKEAEIICKAKFASGIIASPKSENENRILFEKRTDTTVPLLLGLKKSEEDNQWRWTDGMELEWSNWAPGEPSSRKSKQCAVQRAGDMLWKADYCIRPQAYVCQMEPHLHKCPGGKCFNDGQCERQGEEWGCTCKDGYYGDKCENKCGGEVFIFDLLSGKLKIEKPAHLSGNHFVCEWTIKPSEYLHGNKVKLQFERLNLEKSEKCSSDKVSIYEETDGNKKKLGVYCGSDVPSEVIEGEEGSTLFVKFETDRAGEDDDGFKLALKSPFG